MESTTSHVDSGAGGAGGTVGGGGGGRIVLYLAATGERLKVLDEIVGGPVWTSVAFSSDGNCLATVADDATRHGEGGLSLTLDFLTEPTACFIVEAHILFTLAPIPSMSCGGGCFEPLKSIVYHIPFVVNC
jgi:hypothetical protein